MQRSGEKIDRQTVRQKERQREREKMKLIETKEKEKKRWIDRQIEQHRNIEIQRSREAESKRE